MANLAVPTLRTWTPGETEVASYLNANIRDAGNFLLSKPFAILTQSATQSMANASAAGMAFDSTVIDTYGGHSNTVNNSRYVCQAPGWYEVIATSGWATNATGNRLVFIYKNGVVVPYAQSAILSTTTNNSPAVNAVSFVQLAAGDYVEAFAYQSSGGALNLAAAYCSLQLRWAHS